MDAATARPRWTRAREREENFPVALRWLPRDLRDHLHAVYAVARTIDDVGDRSTGDRTARLLALRADLALVWTGDTPAEPVFRELAPTVAACGLAQEPFQRLIEANLADQRVTRYATFEDLLEYCRLSADPIGRIVLGVFGQATPATTALSDRVCTALQILEHCQDVAEDYRAGRIYLPQDDLTGVADEQLITGGPGPRAVVLRQVNRASALLDEGAVLVGRLTGWARIAVGGYVAGGYATARALRAAGGDVWTRKVVPGHVDTVRTMVALLGRAAVVSR
ncbi:squalene synthase HpnC [Nocardia transvalensis]|uniref:Squalene synthase HpnC n=1 Tax=Nocardia transvalensis TaxID=37333 RepID=A0A7W9P9R1_9NOCA|nr:squalene synthase HpnC [Nocardia transvalensis]MBB5912116.1 squalene synthase HpnC [Nocardia transvalensis]